MRLPVYFLLFLGFFNQGIIAQSAAIGEFTGHLPYNQASVVCVAENKIYVGTDPTMYVYDTEDGSFTTFSKVNNLSDLGVTAIEYSETYKTVIIGYETGNIDVIVNNQIINVPDIARTTVQGFKSINHIQIKDQFAYLSTGFGIVKFDIQRKEIKETYFIGENATNVQVNGVVFLNDTIYAATEEGLYLASLNSSNLANFQNWSKHSLFKTGVYNAICASDSAIIMNKEISGFKKDTLFYYNNYNWSKPSINDYNYQDVYSINFENGEWLMSFNYSPFKASEDLSTGNRIYTYNFSSGPAPREFIAGKNGEYWIADVTHGLVKMYNTSTFESFSPGGPAYTNSWEMDYYDGKLWVVTGALSPSLGNNYEKKGLYKYENKEWTSYNSGGIDSLYDLVSVAINPANSNEVYFGSYGRGLGRLENGELKNVYNEYNSGIQAISVFPWRGPAGLAYDSKNVLWVACSGLPGAPVQNPLVAWDGTNWHEFNLNNKFVTNTNAGQLLIDDFGYKWIVSQGNGVFIFDDNGTLTDDSDDRLASITTGENTGNLPTKTIRCLALDKDGAAWIGTDEGLMVVTSTVNVFEEQLKADRIIIEQDGEFQYLLETEIITSIKVDGGNRKWIGTLSGGVYLVSADGQKTIHHFTTDNSPIFSNTIYDVEIFGETGEVFIATDKGMISYMSDATDESEYTGPTYAYPNPVPPNFSGIIGIKGLVPNAEVKITDITGNLIYETISEGTTATWDGYSLNGNKAQTGVYIVFSVSDDGTQKEVTKILFIN